MLEFNTIDFKWDGKVDGKEVDEGTYFVKYKAVGHDKSVK